MADIRIENLKYKYPGTDSLALDGISLNIRSGEFIGVIGENNAGKSTFCQSLIGLVPSFYRGAYGGTVLIGDMEAAKTPVSELCTKVGIVFQNPFNQLTGSNDTVYEEIAFGLQNLGVPMEEMHKRIKDVLELLDIWEYRDRNPFDLSGGQMQRVAIASVLAMNPEIIVLDEPTSQLDPEGSEEVFRAVNTLTESGKTVIMVEHKIEKIAAYSDRVILMHKGRVVAFDTPEKVFSMDNLSDFGVEAPAFTRICRALGVKNAKTGLYPATIDGAGQLLKERALQQIAEDGNILKSGEEIIKTSSLKFSYTADKEILKGIDICLDGRTTAIIGQNGAGKTTFVKLLKGLLKPVGGSIYYGGEDISKNTVAMMAGKIGLVFQNPNDQIFKNKVIDEVMFGPLKIGMDEKTAREKSLLALKRVELYDKVDENPYDLSLSERKLLAIASILAMDTRVIIFDEPTIAQDYHGRSIIKRIINELRKEEKLVITIIHDMDFVADCFERTVVFAEGKVLLDGTTREVFSKKDILKKAYLSQPHVTQLCGRLGYEGTVLTVEEFINNL